MQFKAPKYLRIGNSEFSGQRLPVVIEGTVHRQPRERQRKCPAWLAAKYRALRVTYVFDPPTSYHANLERFKQLNTGEWACVLSQPVHMVHNPVQCWTERFVWVWRDNRMVELEQYGQHGPRRQVQWLYYV